MSKNPYHSFSNFVLRTPLFSLDYYKALTAEEHISDEKLKSIFKNPMAREALFLASPSLYKELKKWVNGAISDPKKEELLKVTLLKYISRMSSRCTPFGLFAGCAVGEIDNQTNITLKEDKKNKRHTRLDMNYLVSLSQDLAKSKKIREQLLFYPNSSIYSLGDQLRYVEYKYDKAKRFNHIVEIDNSDYLGLILEKASDGMLVKDLTALLVNDEITDDEALGFIEELIESQVLISELEPSVSGAEFLVQIQKVLKTLEGTSELLDRIEHVNSWLKTLDESLGNLPESYIELSDYLKKLETDFELKYLFQTDMILTTKENILSKTIVDSVRRGISVLNKITLPSSNTRLEQFKNAFLKRFETREVKLSIALDVETGIGYRQDQDSGDINPLVDDLIVGNGSNPRISDLKYSVIDAFFQKKLIQSFINKEYCITLFDDDFKEFEEHWDDLPDTVSTMIEVVKLNGQEKIKFSHIGGSSGANLLGRFCHGDDELNTYAQHIVDTESQMNKDKILAEIVHLPESRVGNILIRPGFRKYEIPYLAKSVLPKENQVALDDLYISVKNNRYIQLRSKKLNKEVIPHLTNAHNYSSNSLPVYHFLCDMQTQGMRGGLGLYLGPFVNDYEFIPRIEYKNLMLHEATWNLKKKDIANLQKIVNKDTELLEELTVFRKQKKIPQYVMLIESDNELLINLKNSNSVKMLLNTVKSRTQFSIKEFLFSEDGVVKNHENLEYYANQVVLSFYNRKKLENG